MQTIQAELPTPKLIGLDDGSERADVLARWLNMLCKLEAGSLRPDARLAFHEAAHAVVGLAFGTGVNGVLADVDEGDVAFLSFDEGHPLSQQNIMLLAGQFGETIATRFLYRPFDGDLCGAIWLARATQSETDQSRVLRNLMAGHSNNDAVIKAYRAAEDATIEFLALPPIRSAIAAVADELLKTGHLSGDEVLAVTSRFFTPGEFSNKGDHL